MQEDSLVKYIDQENNMRIIATNATITVDDARIRHRLYPIPAIALGRLLIGGLLMASTLKEEAVVTLTVHGDGPLSMLTADASYEGYVRGYCNVPGLDMPELEKECKIAPAIGSGQLSVIKYTNKDAKPYTGVVELSGEIGTDIAYYYYTSEQIPTAISLGVYVGTDGRVGGAGGILVQALPPQKDDFLQKLETIFSRSPAITELTLDQTDADAIVQAYLPGFSLERMEHRSPMFKCSCGKKRSEKALIALGSEELTDILTQDGHVDITCDYCGQHYYFNAEDLEKLIVELKK